MVRWINTAFAVALAAFVLANYWPIVKVFDLVRADLQYQGEWIGGHAKRITAVTPGGVADRAGLKPGDVLEFDPGRGSDWVLASYRNMPEGFSASLPVRRADGSRAIVTLEPDVVDVQFAISRTLVYGAVSTVVLVFLAVLHWLLGRMIEHSGLAFGVEGLAAVGLGFVLHRASQGINTTVDRVLFRKHHAAEERLRQVTEALPFASTEQSIAQAIVVEPARNLELASAALFYRDSSEGPLRRVLAVRWNDGHAASLDAESLLVRYLQAEHSALRLDDEQDWLPAGMPEGSAHPVLAIPIVTQHVLTAVVLYGAHVNATLPDPDEVTLLEALAKAAATSHQQVRIAMLMREMERQRTRIGELEASGAELRDLVRVRLSGPQGAGQGVS